VQEPYGSGAGPEVAPAEGNTGELRVSSDAPRPQAIQSLVLLHQRPVPGRRQPERRGHQVPEYHWLQKLAVVSIVAPYSFTENRLKNLTNS